MADGGLTYSRLVALLKVLLPLCALALLATLFLLSRNIGGDLSNAIPFARGELEQRARDQQITAPFFSGKTSQGHLVRFTARSARPDPEIAGRSSAREMDARIDFADGSHLVFTADSATVDTRDDAATLEGGVQIESSNGYLIRTEALTTAMRELRAETAGTVTGRGPAGRFEAGRMLVFPAETEDEVTLFFTNGVRLVYTPPKK
ncbi:LPS export ABC transporter periplasmic protein LptC [Shimia sp.]|uniref:LPS export ABC transporter periplasmic protein LptC n=1 Tax=Shimia sp. TaxID=1954381 RepID=UPI00356A05E8